MYESMNGAGVNRLPRNTKPETPPAPTGGSTLGKTIGTTLIQAAAIVVAVKIVDAVIELAMARLRKPRQQPQPGRARQEEMAA